MVSIAGEFVGVFVLFEDVGEALNVVIYVFVIEWLNILDVEHFLNFKLFL